MCVTLNSRDFHRTFMFAVWKLGTENFVRQKLVATNCTCFLCHSVAWILTCCCAQFVSLSVRDAIFCLLLSEIQTHNSFSDSLAHTNWLYTFAFNCQVRIQREQKPYLYYILKPWKCYTLNVPNKSNIYQSNTIKLMMSFSMVMLFAISQISCFFRWLNLYL